MRELPPEPGRPYAVITAEHERTILDIPVAAVERLYRAHGALLFKGFAVDPAGLGRFAERISVTSILNEGVRRSVLDRVHAIQTAAGGTRAFPLHPELSREPWRPDVAMFACLRAPRAGGETLICDGTALAAAIPDPIRRNLERRRLRYTFEASAEMLALWFSKPAPTDEELAAPPPHCPFTFVRVGGRVLRSFSRPVLQPGMFVDRPTFANFLLFAHFALGAHVPVFDDGGRVPALWLEAIRAIGERLSAAIAWSVHDLLILDNTRFMHGRNAIEDEGDRNIITHFGYLRSAPPNPEEPADPPWRRPGFKLPAPSRKTMEGGQ